MVERSRIITPADAPTEFALSFPPSPTVGQIYQNWQWDGTKWVAYAPAASGTAAVQLTYAASMQIDFSKFINAYIVLTGNLTLLAPQNLSPGQCGVIDLIQDNSGGRQLLSADPAWIWQNNGGPFPLAQNQNSMDSLLYLVDANGKLHVNQLGSWNNPIYGGLRFLTFAAGEKGSFTVPSNFNNSSNTSLVVGAGCNGSASAGGGGGAYSSAINFQLTAGATVYYQCGVPQVFGSSNLLADTWVNTASNAPPTSTSTGILAKGALNATGANNNNGVSGSQKYNGGNGSGAYGGGSAGSSSSGGNASSSQGGAGGGSSYQDGAGGTSASPNGGNGISLGGNWGYGGGGGPNGNGGKSGGGGGSNKAGGYGLIYFAW